VAADGSWIDLSVVLMGSDRTSLHKPQFCLEGMGLHIDDEASAQTSVRVERPEPYDLPVVKLVATGQITKDGGSQSYRGVYVYWFVADNSLSASVSGVGRMWSMASQFVRTGVLQRWAYVTCFAVCGPGQEDATFERMRAFIAASVPEFQLTPRPAGAVAVK
jgi:hypothetical protein